MTIHPQPFSRLYRIDYLLTMVPLHEGAQVCASLNRPAALLVSHLPFSPELADTVDYTLFLSPLSLLHSYNPVFAATDLLKAALLKVPATSRITCSLTFMSPLWNHLYLSHCHLKNLSFIASVTLNCPGFPRHHQRFLELEGNSDVLNRKPSPEQESQHVVN